MVSSDTAPDNHDYSFSQLTPDQQNALLRQHNRWFLTKLTEAEATISQQRKQMALLEQLAEKHSFYKLFTAELSQDKDLTVQDLKRIKALCQTNPVLADLAIDELIDTLKDRAKARRLDAKVTLGLTPPQNTD